jgi:mRNA-degrading endonuclease RelE of RelBE toxin-antitoxin system
VTLHSVVRDTIRRHGLANAGFRPTLAQLLAALQRDPKAFPKKSGPLHAARAAKLRFRGAAWRAVFTVDEVRRIVKVWSLGPHDRAYAQAERRLN